MSHRTLAHFARRGVLAVVAASAAMLLAQPYLHLFAPAHSLESLRDVGAYLGKL